MPILLSQDPLPSIYASHIPHKRLRIHPLVLDPELKLGKPGKILDELRGELLEPVNGRDVVRLDDAPVGEVCWTVLATEAGYF